MASSSDEQWFDASFDEYLNKSLIKSVQKRMGCFHCGAREKDGVKLLSCSKCHVAQYCGRDCQVADWKKQHKDGCATHCENRDHPAGFTMGEVLKGGGIVDLDELETYLKARRGAFFRMMKETHTGDDRASINLSASINWQWQTLWVAGEVTFWGGDGVCSVNRILFDAVDKGERERARPEKLSKVAMRKTHDILVEFAKQVHESNGMISGLTFGRGLIGQVDNESLMDRIKDTGCEVAFSPMVASNHLPGGGFGF